MKNNTIESITLDQYVDLGEQEIDEIALNYQYKIVLYEAS